MIGVLPGVLGTIQATEAIKFLLGQGELLTGRLLTYDALRMKFREVPVRKNRNCPICGENPTITELKDELDAMNVCDLGTNESCHKSQSHRENLCETRSFASESVWLRSSCSL